MSLKMTQTQQSWIPSYISLWTMQGISVLTKMIDFQGYWAAFLSVSFPSHNELSVCVHKTHCFTSQLPQKVPVHQQLYLSKRYLTLVEFTTQLSVQPNANYNYVYLCSVSADIFRNFLSLQVPSYPALSIPPISIYSTEYGMPVLTGISYNVDICLNSLVSTFWRSLTED